MVRILNTGAGFPIYDLVQSLDKNQMIHIDKNQKIRVLAISDMHCKFSVMHMLLFDFFSKIILVDFYKKLLPEMEGDGNLKKK